MATTQQTSETVPVQMRLRKQTIDRIEHLKKLTGVNNRTRLVSSAVELADEIAGSMKRGAKVYIENPDGTKERIRILGF